MSLHTAVTEGPPIPRFKLHHRLSLVLEEYGITPTEMAEALGVHVNTVYNYMSGARTAKRASIKVWAMRCGRPDLWEWIETGLDTDGSTGTDPEGSTSIAPANQDPDQEIPVSKCIREPWLKAA